MGWTQDIDDANTFFAITNHVRGLDWANYTTDERTGAIAQAKREIELFCNRDVCDPSTGDRFRDDYAVFEQALFILDETVRTKESENSAQMIETVDTEQRDRFYGVTLSPIAQKYLAQRRVKICRG